LNRKLLLFISFAISAFNGFSQPASIYKFSTDDALKEKISQDITIRSQKIITTLQGPNKKYLAEVYKEREEYVKKELNSIITDKTTQDYLYKLAQEILKNNSFLKAEEFRILFSRTLSPNAFSVGVGAIFFHAGLFYRMQNESQAAFVLCHEMAHDYLHHSNQNIEQTVNTLYSEQFQKELKKLSKQQYGRNAEAEKLLKNLTFKNQRYSREFEESADSMAIELMKNTEFDIHEALSCLALLDSVDHTKYDSRFALEKVFSFQNYPFKKSWLEEDAFRFASTEEEQKEAELLKTHPDCAVRIDRIKEKVNRYYKNNSKRFVVDERMFNELKSAFDYDIIKYYHQHKNISVALFLSLQTLQVYPDDLYLQTMAGKCLNEIYDRQKNHTLGTVIDLPNPEFNKSYNSFLHFLQNLRLPEVAALSYYFLLQYQTPSNTSNEEFTRELILSKVNFDKTDEKQQWMDFYRKNFPTSKYNF